VDIGNLQGLGICIDGSNGAAGPLAVQSFQELSSEVRELYCDIDGNFPNHGPDPSQSDNLKDLQKLVVKTESHLGIALDGDGDRMVAVDELGNIVTPDQLFLVFARDLLSRTPDSTLVFDVKASRQLARKIQDWGGNALMERSGRTFIQNRVKASGALLGGEYSSHYFFRDRWKAIDDGIYAACRLAEILQRDGRPLSEILAEFPSLPATEELEIKVSEEDKAEIFDKFRQNADFPGAELVEIDGLRIEYPQSWGLVRVSNTGPKLSVRFEGENEQALLEIQNRVRQEFDRLYPRIKLPF
jgi:phosphomannomutase/phosphoglucomutase